MYANQRLIALTREQLLLAVNHWTARMNRFLRPTPYPPNSPARRYAMQLLRSRGYTYHQALSSVGAANRQARYTPLKKEKCEARTRKGTPCRCKALRNGRCKFHGGMSTGPDRTKSR